MLSDPTTERLRDVFAAHSAVRAAYVFGSAATGTDRPESDIDIGLVVDDEQWEPRDKVELLGECVGKGIDRIDLVVLNEAPLVVQFEAVRPNVPLYGADDFDHGAFISKVVRKYWDFEPYLERQRKAYKERRLEQSHGSS